MFTPLEAPCSKVFIKAKKYTRKIQLNYKYMEMSNHIILKIYNQNKFISHILFLKMVTSMVMYKIDWAVQWFELKKSVKNSNDEILFKLHIMIAIIVNACPLPQYVVQFVNI